MATPLLLCLVCVELSDVVFAFDSVPAVRLVWLQMRHLIDNHFFPLPVLMFFVLWTIQLGVRGHPGSSNSVLIEYVSLTVAIICGQINLYFYLGKLNSSFVCRLN